MNHIMISQRPVSIGIDVSLEKLDVALLAPDHTTEVRTYDNTTIGITRLLADLKTQRTAKTVPCIIESTGSIHFLVALMVAQAGYAVKCINPLITKKYQRASIRNAKSDRVDAKRLAEIGFLEPDLRLYKGSEETLLISKLIGSLAKCEKVRQQLVSHRKQLLTSIALIDATLDVTNYDTAITALEEQIGTLKALLCAHAPEEAVELAANMKGISTEQTSILLAALKDKQFAHRDQLGAFVGLDVMSRKSGAWVGKQKLSKRGNAYLRKVLYQMAWGLKTHHEEFRVYYEHLREKGHHYTTCLIAVARKFIRFLFAFYYKRSVTFPQVSV